jgi:hypothetical protein
MGLERDIHELLFDHDCVIVPRWGGFLAQYKPARLDESRALIHPPGKAVGFNRHLLRTDGLLADRLAQRDGIGYAAANAVIDAEVDAWQAELARHGRLELSRIGIFYRDTEHNLQFDPDDRANFLKEAYGLRPLAAAPVLHGTVRTIPLVTPAAPKGTDKRTVRPRWKMAVAASVALLLTSGAYWSLATENGQHAREGLAQRITPPAPTYMPGTLQPVPMTAAASVFTLPEEPLGIQTLPLTENDSVTLTVDLGIPEKIAPADTTHVAVSTPSLERARYHIIGGCFAQPENADRLLKELEGKGFPALRLKQYGELHPVAFGSYPNRTMALEALARIRSTGAGQAWLLVR